MDDGKKSDKSACGLCGGTSCLTQKGILKIYLLGFKSPLALIAVGLAGGAFYSKYMLIFATAGFILPLAMADFRLYLYPVAAIAQIFGRKLSCPKCEPHCSMFRHG